MNTLLLSGYSGRMGAQVRQLAPAYGFSPQPFGRLAGDVIVDFSHPDCLDRLLSAGLPLVLGTTGFPPEAQARIAAAARSLPIFQSANFSPGIFAMTRALQQLTAALPGWTLYLTERHHADKRDLPSGTARTLAQAVGLPESRILSIRAGTVRGIHTAELYGPEESLLLSHTAESRAAFAHGALQAARWLLKQKNGLYGLEDLYRP